MLTVSSRTIMLFNAISLILLCLFLEISESSLDSYTNVSSLKDEVQQLKHIAQKYSSNIDDLMYELKKLKSRIAAVETHPRKQRQINSQARVAFHVQLTTDIPRLGDHQPIVFDLIKTNIGNGYNKVDGIFTAPVSGTYVFAWVTTNKDRSFMNTELVVNAQLYGKAMADAMDHADYAAATNVAIVNLTEGDEVWVRSGTWHNGHIAGDLYSTFSGWLLY